MPCIVLARSFHHRPFFLQSLTDYETPFMMEVEPIYKLNNNSTEEIMPATIGAPAPEFTLKDQDQKEVKLSDYRGKKRVVLVFYPLDWSPVCTKEHACMVNDKKQFDQLDAQVLGISVDSVWSHKAYADKMGIHYPLLADFHPRGAVAAKYGVYLEDKGITGRAISIIDRNGNLAWHKNYDIPVVPDINEVSQALAAVK
jgi:mycoredoxin-dependent peroxiredoxin